MSNKADEAFRIFKASIEKADADHAAAKRRIDRNYRWTMIGLMAVVILSVAVPLIIQLCKDKPS